jgi:hypothetical protein
VKITRPKLSIVGENAPLGAWLRMCRSPLVGLRLQMPLTTSVLSYSSRLGYRCANPLRGRSVVNRMRSSLA